MGAAQLKAVPAPKTRPTGRLSGRAGQIYRELAPVLELSGRLRPEFDHILRLYCQTLAVAEKAGAKLVDVEAPGRSDKRTADPAWRGFRDATELACRLAREYGLTPASAAQVKVGATPDEQAARLLA
jgi:phage terminase small subunit